MKINNAYVVTLFLALLLSLSGTGQPLFVPLEGNSWIVNNTLDEIDHRGMHKWEDSETIIGTYLKVNNPGQIDVSLVGSTDGSRSTLKCWSGKRSYAFELTNSQEDTVHIGLFTVEAAGYIQFEIQGLEKTARNFANVKGFIVAGTAIDSNTVFVKDDYYWGRRGPSVHLTYDIPAEASDVVWYYNEITVPKGEDVIGSYFMANGFAEGYFGIQVNSREERRVLFSVWSPYETDDPESIPEEYRIKLLAKGEGVQAGEFGNEGSGGQSYLKYMWVVATTYRFLLKGVPSENNSTDYTAYFYAPELKRWLLIASFRRPKTSNYIKRPHSFLENFITETGYLSRQVSFSNQWIYDSTNKWHELTTATFTADATARKGSRMDYLGGVVKDTFFLQNCGFFNSSIVIGKKLQRKPTGISPSIDFSSLPH